MMAAGGGLWVRSYSRFDSVAGLTTATGTVNAELVRRGRRWVMFSREADRVLRGEKVFRFASGHAGKGAQAITVWIPHWFAALLTTPVSSWWVMKRLRLKRLFREGCCTHCGYDL